MRVQLSDMTSDELRQRADSIFDVAKHLLPVIWSTYPFDADASLCTKSDMAASIALFVASSLVDKSKDMYPQ